MPIKIKQIVTTVKQVPHVTYKEVIEEEVVTTTTDNLIIPVSYEEVRINTPHMNDEFRNSSIGKACNKLNGERFAGFMYTNVPPDFVDAFFATYEKLKKLR